MKGGEPEIGLEINDRSPVVLTFRLEEKVRRLLDSYSIKQRLSRSEIIRYAIEKLLNEKPEYEVTDIPPGPGNLTVISFKADRKMKEELDNYARDRKVSRSEAVRYAVIRLLREEGVLG